jgi:hypothetical protein
MHPPYEFKPLDDKELTSKSLDVDALQLVNLLLEMV